VNFKKENKAKKCFIDHEMIQQDVSKIKWESEVDNGSIEKSWEAFKTVVLSAENKHTWVYWLPLPQTLSSLPEEVLRTRRKKKRAWTKYINCKCYNQGKCS